MRSLNFTKFGNPEMLLNMGLEMTPFLPRVLKRDSLQKERVGITLMKLQDTKYFHFLGSVTLYGAQLNCRETM